MNGRRRFLRGLCSASVALPLLSPLPRSRAQSVQFPTRFIVFFTPNGVEADAWFPTAGAGPSDFMLGRCHAPLATMRDRLVLTSGIDLSVTAISPGEEHQRGMGTLLTGRENNIGEMVGGDGSLSGWSLGTSIDQVIAQRIGQRTRFPSLELGIRADVARPTGEVRTRLIFSAPEVPLVPVSDPGAVFERMFSDASTDIASLRLQQESRRSVLDGTLRAFAELGTRVGAEDRARLEEHAAMVRDLEQRLGALSFGGCSAPLQPPALEVDDERTMPEISRLQTDLLVAALACDLTRVGSLQYSNSINELRFPWCTFTNEAGQQVSSLSDGHLLSHNVAPSAFDAREEAVARATWYSGEFAYLLDRLASIPEGEGTLLDHTAVLWVNELSDGATHSHTNMPFLVAGGGGGRIRTGQYLAFDGEPHNNLLLALLHGFGFDDRSFGHPDFCTRPLPGLLR